MIGIAGLIVAAAIGVDYGWQQTDDGQLEYIIQISPDQVESLKEGEEIASFLPPEAERVTCFRVQIGSGKLPRETVLTPSGPIEAMPATGYEDPNFAPTLRRPGQMNVSDNRAPQGQWNGNQFAPAQTNPQTPSDPYLYARPATQPDPYRTGQVDATFDSLGNRQASNALPNTTTAGTTGFVNNNTTGSFRTQSGTTLNTSLTNPTGNQMPMNNQDAPWLPLLLTGTALFLSLGGNAYLGWIAAEFYTRYRDTVERMRAERRY